MAKVVLAEEKNEVKAKGKALKRLRLILPAVLLIALVAGALVWALPRLPAVPPTQNNVSYQGVLELWNVESFEGGVGSRESWLKNRAARFEKVNAGLFVHVTTLSAQQLVEKLQQNEKFDMICFSRGTGALVKDRLIAADVDCGEVKNNFALSGQVNGVQYAIPVYTGAYCLFAREEMLSQQDLPDNVLSRTYTRKVGKSTVTLAPLVCGFTPYNSPLSALAMSGVKGNVNVSDDTTQYQAYEQFLGNRTAVTLLGTQRDMYRLAQREADGRLESLSFAPLGGYTDLVQYLGIASDKKEICEKFAQHLLSSETQATLVDMCMFSVLEQTFYTSDRFAQSEALLNGAYVPNVFGDENAVARQRQTALETLAV